MLFAGHDTGAQNWGIIASLIETAKLNKIEPQAYLTATLKAIVAGHRQSQIELLLPWNHTAEITPCDYRTAYRPPSTNPFKQSSRATASMLSVWLDMLGLYQEFLLSSLSAYIGAPIAP